MSESVLTLLPNGGSTGWDQMGLGYDGTPIDMTVYSATGKSVIFSLTNAAAAGDISKITIWYRVTTNEAYGRHSWVYCINNLLSTNYETAGIERAESTPTWYSVDVTTNPRTGVAWTWDDIDALQSGIRVYTSYAGSCHLYQFKVTVTYNPSTYAESGDVGGNAGISPGIVF